MIKKIDVENHKDVTLVEFGHGSVIITLGRTVPDDSNRLLILTDYSENPKNIGEIITGKEKKTVISKRPEVILKFENPESITALMTQLILLQRELFNM
jgi:hypothetical protein